MMEGHYRDHPIGPLPLDQITFLTDISSPLHFCDFSFLICIVC